MRTTPMDMPTSDFVRVGSLAELKAKGQLVVHGRHSPILVVYDGEHVFALDNRCPHMGFPLDRGSVEDGILTCHWHHARFDLASGCTFDLWADDVPTCPVEVRDGEVWIKPFFGHDDPSGHWRDRLDDGLAHNLGTSSHFGFLGCGGVGWLGWGRLRRCSAGRARWRPSEGQGFQELGPGGEHNIGAQGLQVVEEAGSGSKRLAGVPPSA